jgi:hypothetical protein
MMGSKVAKGVDLNRFLLRAWTISRRVLCRQRVILRLEDLHQRIQSLLFGLRSAQCQELLRALQQIIGSA